MNGLVQEGRKWLFRVTCFFLQKCQSWIFACAFQLSSKTFWCTLFAGLHFVSEENEDKISKHAQWMQQSRTRAFRMIQENVVLLIKLKSTGKNSGTFEGKEILPEKVTYIPLAPSHSIKSGKCFIVASEA